MGSWGRATFESDTACDFVGHLVRWLQKAIGQDLKAAATDHILERPVIAAVACLGALVASIEAARHLVSRRQVESWRREYFHWFDQQVDVLGGPDSDCVKESRRNDEREFRKLLRYLPPEKPGDDPLTDLLVHGLHPFPKDIEKMVLALHQQDPFILGHLVSEPLAWANWRVKLRDIQEEVAKGRKWLREQLAKVERGKSPVQKARPKKRSGK
jgi:hypothetical protein